MLGIFKTTFNELNVIEIFRAMHLEFCNNDDKQIIEGKFSNICHTEYWNFSISILLFLFFVTNKKYLEYNMWVLCKFWFEYFETFHKLSWIFITRIFCKHTLKKKRVYSENIYSFVVMKNRNFQKNRCSFKNLENR